MADIDPKISEEIRRLSSRTPVKAFNRSPREAEGGELDMATYPKGRGHVLTIKLRGRWHDVAELGEAAGSPAGSTTGAITSAGGGAKASDTSKLDWSQYNDLVRRIKTVEVSSSTSSASGSFNFLLMGA